jgi:hypothetical protein
VLLTSLPAQACLIAANQTTNQPANQSTNQPTNQPTSQLTNQPANRRSPVALVQLAGISYKIPLPIEPPKKSHRILAAEVAQDLGRMNSSGKISCAMPGSEWRAGVACGHAVGENNFEKSSNDTCGVRTHALSEWRLEPPP